MALHKVVEESAKKLKDGVHHIEVEKTHDGKYLTTMHMHDMEHHKHGMKHTHTSHHALARHINEHMPLEEPDDEGD